MSSPVILVLGAGANVGLSIAKKFAAEGWKVAAVARTIKDEIKANSSLALSADFSDPESMIKIFNEVEAKLGTPNVVVYNAYFISFADITDPLGGMSISDMSKGLIINSVSAFAAAKHAVAGFQKLPSGVPTAYIYTGNMASYLVVPETVSLGSGKNASLYFVEAAAHAYREKGYRFYFADERTPEGGSTMDLIDGSAHGEEFWKLANSKEQAPVNYTFVKGKGYVKFESDRIREVKGLHKLFKEAHDFHDGPK